MCLLQGVKDRNIACASEALRAGIGLGQNGLSMIS
jgi:hypothetical protein